MKKYFVIFLFIFSACSFFKKDKLDNEVARVYDEYLSASDLVGIIPPGTNAKDSLLTIRNYINNWIRKKTILHKALQNLTKEQTDFSKQLDDYRNSLIIYAYEKELIRQKLDTNVTEKEIADYYENNKSNFELKENIVKVIYVKLERNSASIPKARKLSKSEKAEDKKNLVEYCQKNAVNYFVDDESWLFFNDLLKEIPIKTYDQESYLKNHRYIETEDSLYYYFVNIKGFKIKESISPLSFEKENIRNIILNKRKVDLINKMHDDVFKEALKNNNVETY